MIIAELQTARARIANIPDPPRSAFLIVATSLDNALLSSGLKSSRSDLAYAANM